MLALTSGWPILPLGGGSPTAAAEPPQVALITVRALIAFGENEGACRCSVLELSYQPPETLGRAKQA